MIFLTEPELAELTGRTTPAAQRRCLDNMGISHKTNAVGKVIVLRQHACDVLAGGQKRRSSSTIEPRFDLIK